MFFRNNGTKYNNKKTSYNGHYYDSMLEANYAMYLDILVKAKVVDHWEGQVVKRLDVNGKTVCTYRLDFEVYYTNGKVEYVEVKGFWTDVARIKVKLFEALENVTVTVVKEIPRLR